MAKELRLDWQTVKSLEMDYMRAQLERAGPLTPRAIGIDEISIRKGHTYRIVVSDLELGRAIWFGGKARKEAEMAKFYESIGKHVSSKIEVAVMDMWKPFQNAILIFTLQTQIVFDKFHAMAHLGKAMDEVRKAEYARLSGEDRGCINDMKYTPLSNRENLSLEGRKALKQLLAANKRMNTAYPLKEHLGQLCNLRTPAGARKFSDRWRETLKWQRPNPYEAFAEMVERYWGGIVSYCTPTNKIALGFVEGLENKIRGIQRRAYGPGDEEFLRLKILTC